jgi:hypothetical protein
VGHHISAVVLRGPFDTKLAQVFDLRSIRLNEELTLFPLDASYIDHWSERLGVEGFHAGPLLNAEVIHHMINAIAHQPLFAVIETDYFGGYGSQTAIVYRGQEVVMPAASAPGGPINRALRMLGVTAGANHDEFDTVGLGRYRDFSDLFDDYHEPPEPASD